MHLNSIVVGLMISTAATTHAQVPSTLSRSQGTDAPVAVYLTEHYQTPEDYVASKFKDHDIVFLGEGHGIKQNLIFLQQMIPRLYREGVRNLGFEMLWSDCQQEVDQLLNADTYDNEKALTLVFDWDPQIGWAFQEYADVLRSAWTLNHSLRKDAPRFRIVGTDMRPDWNLVRPGDAIASRPTRWKAWAGSNQIARNVWMVSVIRHEFVDKGLKALIYNGSGHTTLAVTRDQREETGLRFSAAYQLRRRYGNRITSIEMATSSGQNPMIAPLIAALPPNQQRIGFDVKGTPIGQLPLTEKVAASIVSDKSSLTLEDYVAEGFVQLSLRPEPITVVPGFITEARVAEAKHAGYLPDVPEITAEWILQHQRQIVSSVH